MAVKLSPILKQIAAVAVWLLACLATPGLCAGELEADFAQPPAQWKSRPLWFWNGPLDQARTTEIMERSVASGYHGFGILPTEDMGVAFMSPEFLAHYQARRGHGGAAGPEDVPVRRVLVPQRLGGRTAGQRHPEALGKRLDLVETDVTGPDALQRSTCRRASSWPPSP